MPSKITQEEFIRRASLKHNNFYDYSKTAYIHNKSKITIVCPLHGDFSQIPCDHLNGSGCKQCAVQRSAEYKKLTWKTVLARFREVHRYKYKYDKTTYVNTTTKMIIICSEHGEFFQTPSSHMNGSGCPKFGKKSIRLTQKEFVKKAEQVHENKYDYSLTNYTHNRNKVIIICPKHGEFEQLAKSHLAGNGCPTCSLRPIQKSVKEKDLKYFIKSFGYDVKTIKPDWLKLSDSKKPSELDIFIPELNLAIEYNGTYWHSHLRKNSNYHELKYLLCLQNGVNLLHIFEFENLDKWKRKLKLYFQNPEKYKISFKNNKRTLTLYSQEFIHYGQSFIKKVN